MEKWTENDIPNLDGKVIVITGANSGLGFENSKQFAKKGATVVMACRNLKKGEIAKNKILKDVPDAKLKLMELNLGDLESIKQFAEEFKKEFEKLDVLLNNAGIMMVPFQKTKDGFESQLGTNFLGHFALTALLFDVLRNTAGSRIVNVSSLAHKTGKKIEKKHFLSEEGYNKSEAYSRSKLANLLFSYELGKRVEAKNLDMKVVAVHPGIATTSLADHLIPYILRVIIRPIFRLFLIQSSAKGALPSSRAATDPNVKNNEYYGPSNPKGTKGYPVKIESEGLSHDEELAKEVWSIAEELTGIQFEI